MTKLKILFFYKIENESNNSNSNNYKKKKQCKYIFYIFLREFKDIYLTN